MFTKTNTFYMMVTEDTTAKIAMKSLLMTSTAQMCIPTKHVGFAVSVKVVGHIVRVLVIQRGSVKTVLMKTVLMSKGTTRFSIRKDIKLKE